jgi:hypothetical protein
MKKRILLFGVLLNFFMNSGLYASTTEEFRVDKFRLNLSADIIVGQLWRDEDVRDEDIEGAFSAVISSGENSGASSDEESKPGGAVPSAQSERVESLISDFLEVTEDVARGRSKTGKGVFSLEAFAQKVRGRGQKNTPFVVELVLNNIAGKYC